MNDMNKIIFSITPTIITIIGNLVFYLWVKVRFDKSIERNKIAYSGIFKEKVNIYRELLDKTYVIKKDLNRFRHIGTKEDVTEIIEKINNYIQFYSINQPFLSDEMLSNLNKIRTEFQDIFDKFYLHIANGNSNNLSEFFEAGNKLKSNNPFKEIEERIITEMRKDLKVSEFGK